MFHLTLFAGTETEMTPSEFTSFTMFGGAELRLPTIAAQLLHLKQPRHKPQRGLDRMLRTEENLVVTLFGGTEISPPLIADEYLALSGALASGALTTADVAPLFERLLRDPKLRSGYKSLTLFGGCTRGQPDVGDERDALNSARRSGALDDRTHDALLAMVGASAETRIRGLQSLLVGGAHGRAHSA